MAFAGQQKPFHTAILVQAIYIPIRLDGVT